MNGDLEYAKVNKDSILAKSTDVPQIDDVVKSDADLELRNMVRDEEKVLKTNKKLRK